MGAWSCFNEMACVSGQARINALAHGMSIVIALASWLKRIQLHPNLIEKILTSCSHYQRKRNSITNLKALTFYDCCAAWPEIWNLHAHWWLHVKPLVWFVWGKTFIHEFRKKWKSWYYGPRSRSFPYGLTSNWSRLMINNRAKLLQFLILKIMTLILSL